MVFVYTVAKKTTTTKIATHTGIMCMERLWNKRNDRHTYNILRKRTTKVFDIDRLDEVTTDPIETIILTYEHKTSLWYSQMYAAHTCVRCVSVFVALLKRRMACMQIGRVDASIQIDVSMHGGMCVCFYVCVWQWGMSMWVWQGGVCKF